MNYIRAGTLIMFLHDCSDYLLEVRAHTYAHTHIRVVHVQLNVQILQEVICVQEIKCD